MYMLLLIVFAIGLWLGVTALVAWGVEAVWDDIAPAFYPDMPFWVAFVAVLVLGYLMRKNVSVVADDGQRKKRLL